jgi:DNA polymerase-3 subunit delta'
MHSFLIIGGNKNSIEDKIVNILKEYQLKRIDFNGQKIEEIRAINSFISLSLTEKTGIVINNIEKSTIEAVNAFLKNLEEPQEKLYFILTAPNINRVLPTIVSRCQVIYSSEKREIEKSKELEDFINMDSSEKFSFLDKFRKREDAIIFFEELTSFLHQKLVNKNGNFPEISKLLEESQDTLLKLGNNGNVNLQLTKYVVNTDNFESLTHLRHEV